MASDLYSGITVLCFHIAAQVNGRHKGHGADGAAVWSLARVNAQVIISFGP